MAVQGWCWQCLKPEVCRGLDRMHLTRSWSAETFFPMYADWQDSIWSCNHHLHYHHHHRHHSCCFHQTTLWTQTKYLKCTTSHVQTVHNDYVITRAGSLWKPANSYQVWTIKWQQLAMQFTSCATKHNSVSASTQSIIKQTYIKFTTAHGMLITNHHQLYHGDILKLHKCNENSPGLIKQLIRVPRLTTNGCRIFVQWSNQHLKACNSMSLVNPGGCRFKTFHTNIFKYCL